MKGRTAVITGATRGIGLAVAGAYKAAGARVIGISSSKDGDASACDEHLVADLSDRAATIALAERLGKMDPDVLVNNAGINKIAPFAKISLEDFEEIQTVNLLAPFLLSRAVVPGMKRKGWGRIVNIASIFGKISRAQRASYSSSKFALDGLTAAISAEHAKDGILANCISPGFIDTELTRRILSKDQITELAAQVPAGRLGTAEEIAAFVVWIGGPLNTYITGQNLAIDGGFTRV